MSDNPLIGVKVLPAEPREPTKVIVRYLDDGPLSEPITVITSVSQPAEWPSRSRPSSNVRPSSAKTNKQKTGSLAKIEAEMMARAEAAFIESRAKLKIEVDALYAEQNAHIDKRWNELIAEAEKLKADYRNMLDEASGFVTDTVAEIVGRIFAELPTDVIPIVRAAMDRAAGHAPREGDGPLDIGRLLHAMGRLN